MADMERGEPAAELAPQGKVEVLMEQINGVTDQMKINIDKVLEREIKAEDLLRISENMQEEAKKFESNGKILENSFRCKNIKLIVPIVVIVLIVVVIIILLAIGVIPISAPVTPTASPTSKP